jgi:hypothetical protein
MPIERLSMIEPGYIAVIVTVILALTGAGMYVIRAEVRKGNVVAEATAVEMVPNHGSSMRDAIDRIEARQVEDRATFLGHIADLHGSIAAIRNRQDQHIDGHNKGA